MPKAQTVTTPIAPPAPLQQPVQLAAKHVHFVGIGGCGMSGLARLVKMAGASCTGSDIETSPIIDQLMADQINVSLDQSANALPDRCDLLVVSAAISPDHPQVILAKERQTPVMKYAQMLGQLMIDRVGVAIAGTHGKSTTTSILSHVLIQAQLDPSFIVGATCRQIGGGWRSGASDILVAEACEFDRSFHHLYPTHAAILNVEEDHLDIYGSIDSIVQAFAIFAGKLPAHGSLLIEHEMPHRLAITAGLNFPVETIGFAPHADWHISIQSDTHNNQPQTHLARQGHPVAHWPSPIPGQHMAYNAAVAAVTAHRLGVPWETIAIAIAQFQGLDRRMQWLGRRPVQGSWDAKHTRRTDGWVTVLDDYGHHPTEIDTTLRALRQHSQPNRLICVFQPHQHSRTRFLMEQFAASFSQADIIIVPDIYFVRDSQAERHTVKSADLVDRLRQRGKLAMHLYPFEAIVEQLQIIAQPGDLLVTMGAGDVWKIAHRFMGSYLEASPSPIQPKSV